MRVSAVVATLLGAAAAALFVWTCTTLGWRRLLAGLDEQPKVSAARLVLGGPYAHVRHPQCLSLLLLLLALATASGRWLAWVTFSLAIVVVLFAARAEERALRNRFGEAYERYRAAVPFLVPRLRRR